MIFGEPTRMWYKVKMRKYEQEIRMLRIGVSYAGGKTAVSPTEWNVGIAQRSKHIFTD